MVSAMTEYIRKQAVLNLIDEFQYNHESNTWGVTKDGVIVLKPDTLDKLHETVKAIPPVDVVEVVRCKDCDCAQMSCDEFGSLSLACGLWSCVESIYPTFVDDDGFCSYGKSKKQGGKENAEF